MDSEALKLLWISTALGAGVAVIITLIAAPDAIPRWSVIALAILGTIFFSGAAVGLNWAKLHPFDTKSVGVFIVIGIVMGVLGLAVWPKSKVGVAENNIQPSSVHVETIQPHLQTRLVIDSIPQDTDIEFHIEVENISQLQINGLRVGMWTPEMTSHDVSMPLPPTLPPGGRLSIPGNPASGLKKHGVLFLDLNYESEVGGKTNKSVSSYSFLVRPVDMKPQALLPTTWQEQAGVIFGPEQKTIEAALKTLADPQGTMLFALPLLRPDGSPNLLVMTNNKRRFSFDGASRYISFTTTTSAGNLRTIEQALPVGFYEAIVIGCLWDDQKDEAKLIISGKEFP